jgi:uncharacterized protein YcbK (DUF882 family)
MQEDFQGSLHFSRSELACKDCGRCLIDPALVPAMERYRELANSPFEVLSGYRCPQHNLAIGGAGKSEHVEGKAVDGRLAGHTLQQMYDLALEVPAFALGGIGLYPDGTPFVHLDVRTWPARWCRKNGMYLAISEAGVKL